MRRTVASLAGVGAVGLGKLIDGLVFLCLRTEGQAATRGTPLPREEKMPGMPKTFLRQPGSLLYLSRPAAFRSFLAKGPAFSGACYFFLAWHRVPGLSRQGSFRGRNGSHAPGREWGGAERHCLRKAGQVCLSRQEFGCEGFLLGSQEVGGPADINLHYYVVHTLILIYYQRPTLKIPQRKTCVQGQLLIDCRSFFP